MKRKKETILVAYEYEIEYGSDETRSRLLDYLRKEPLYKVLGTSDDGGYKITRQDKPGVVLEQDK